MPKPWPKSREKARDDRRETKIKSEVRADVMDRDRGCRLFKARHLFGDCEGAREWAHLGDKRRSATRGLPPEERHTPAGSLCLCTRHHQDYDQHRIGIAPLSDRGADGPLEYTRAGATFAEHAAWRGYRGAA